MKCPICNGTGKAQHFHRGPAPGGGVHQSVSYGICAACAGTGRVSNAPNTEKWTVEKIIHMILCIVFIVVGLAAQAWLFVIIGVVAFFLHHLY